MRFNPSQAEAVAHREGPCLILAGPGSGKTFTIAHRIACLIDHFHVKPEEILVITYTRYAATQMRLRFQSLMEGRHLPVTFGTFHSVYFGILKKAYSLTGQNVLSGKEKKALLAQAAEAACCSVESDREEFLRLLETEIGRMKNDGTAPEEFHASCLDDAAFQQIFYVYEAEKRWQHKLDFEDMLTECLRLLQSEAEIRKSWQEKYRYILVDEFQDCNRIQYEVLKLLAEPERNLFVVGDDDQSIYGFRGARPEILQTFATDYPDARQILLNINYRSDAQIVAGSLKVISRNQNRFPKDLHAAGEEGNAAPEAGIRVRTYEDPGAESGAVLEEIKRLLDAGMPAREIAVLFRTGSGGELLAELLSRQRIPFQMREGRNNIYEHFVGRDVRSYLSLADALGERSVPGTRADFLRIANRPNRYLTRESLESDAVDEETLLSFYRGKKRVQDEICKLYEDLALIKDEPPYSAIQYIREGIGYGDFLNEYARSLHMKPEKYLEVLDQIQERAKDFSTTEKWILHVKRFGMELQAQSVGKETEGVQLLTIHSAKGLEYDTVFMICANEGNIPHKKAQLPEEIEEERRLFYVAMTRAKRQLLISCVEKENGRSFMPSGFLKELRDQT